MWTRKKRGARRPRLRERSRNSLQLDDITKRVQFKHDDPDGIYVTDEYVMGFAQDSYEWLFGKLRLVGWDNSEEIIVLPAVPAGLPTLDSYQAVGQPLATLVQPRMIRWKLPGQDPTFWQRSDGPLDSPRDIQNGAALLDSWAWLRYSVKLSNYSTPLDLEMTGEFLFDPLTSNESQIQISIAANRCFASKIASEAAKARRIPDWVKQYGDDADEAFDDLAIAMTKANQGKTRRLGRMNRRSPGGCGTVPTFSGS